jgi:hypothetical protein
MICSRDKSLNTPFQARPIGGRDRIHDSNLNDTPTSFDLFSVHSFDLHFSFHWSSILKRGNVLGTVLVMGRVSLLFVSCMMDG